MTTAAEGISGTGTGWRATDGEPNPEAVSSICDERVNALTAAYYRTVDHIMTTRFGPDWATRGDLPDEAYTTETTFHRWLSELLDHIDGAAAHAAHAADGHPPVHAVSIGA